VKARGKMRKRDKKRYESRKERRMQTKELSRETKPMMRRRKAAKKRLKRVRKLCWEKHIRKKWTGKKRLLRKWIP